MKADEREDKAKKFADRESAASSKAVKRVSGDSAGASAHDSIDEPIDRAAQSSDRQPRFAIRILPPLSEYPTQDERKAMSFGLIVMAIMLVWMMVMAVQRPMKYSEMAETAPWPDMRININTATEAELTVLPGIGPRLAERIVEDRESNGLFDSLDDLARVQMIGPRTVESISPYVMVKPLEVGDALASE